MPIKPQRGTKLNRHHPLAEGLIGAWVFNESTGMIVMDLSGKGHHGTLTNMEEADWLIGEAGKTLDFDGSNEYIATSMPVPITSSNPITIILRSKVASAHTGSSFGTNLDSPNRCQAHVPWSDGNIYWDYGDSGGTGRENTAYGAYGSWKQVALVSEGQSGSYKAIYLDGELEDDGVVSDGPSTSNSNFDIGRFLGDTRYQDCEMEYFYVYDRVLSQDEIKRINADPYQMFGEKRILPITVPVITKLSPRPANIKPPRGTLLNKEHPLARGLVGAWLFNEGTGQKVNDSSINHKQGYLYTMTDSDWGSGIDGHILNFDGTSDYVWVEDGDKQEVYDVRQFTFVTKVRLASITGYRRFATTSTAAANRTSFLMNGANLTYQLHNAGHTNVSNISLSIGVWYHLVLTFDDLIDKIRFYIDGILDDNEYTDTTSIDLGDKDFVIGADDAKSQFMSGDMSYFMFYDRALTATEIKSLYLNSYEMFHAI